MNSGIAIEATGLNDLGYSFTIPDSPAESVSEPGALAVSCDAEAVSQVLKPCSSPRVVPDVAYSEADELVYSTVCVTAAGHDCASPDKREPYDLWTLGTLAELNMEPGDACA